MSKVTDDLKALANGVNFALASMNDGRRLDFMLIVATPKGDDSDEVVLNTVPGIMNPYQIAQIGQHLIDMARAQITSAQEPSLDPDSDTDVRGHA